MFNPGAYENSRPDGISVLEIVNGAEPREQPRRFVPLRRTELGGEIAGPLAALRLTQVYRFSREECPHVVEAVYRFPLPGDAAVTAVRVRFGKVEINAGLKERQKAEKEYEKAKKEGKQAAHKAQHPTTAGQGENQPAAKERKPAAASDHQHPSTSGQSGGQPSINQGNKAGPSGTGGQSTKQRRPNQPGQGGASHLNQ